MFFKYEILLHKLDFQDLSRNLKIEDYLNVCSNNDIKSVKEYFETLNKNEIETIRDEHNAR
jgi:hypothetical protein